MNVTALLMRILPLIIIGASVCARAVDARVAAGPVIPGHTAASAPAASRNLDAMVTEILERPLFSPSRQAAGESLADAQPVPEKEPPKMPGRLAGVAVLPEVREAVFEGDGEKPVVVKEGQEIEGWTVASIRDDRVVLRSAAGEEIVKPADGVGIRRAGAGARRPPTQVQAQAGKAGQGVPTGPVIPTRTPQTPAVPAGPVRQPGRAPTPAASLIRNLAPARIGR